MEDKVILDEQSFKALSADSRVSILKRLNERRMTLSELSKRLDLKGSTIKEHCTILLNAQLIKKIDEGRKWKYYELTGKGKQVVTPSFIGEAKILISLCISAIIFMGILLFAFQALNSLGSASYLSNNQNVLGAEKVFSINDNQTTAVGTIIESDTSAQRDINDCETLPPKMDYSKETAPSLLIPFALIGMLVVGIIIGWIARKKI